MLNSGFSSFSMSVLRATPLILRFFLLALVVAAAVHFVFASDALRIAVFFTFVLTLSLFFPSTWGTVDKEAVDLIYYGTAMFVAAGLFLAKEVERKRLELAPQINSLTQQQHEVEAEISSFDYVASNAPTFLNWIDRRVDEAFDDTERSRSRECNCASWGDLSKFCGFGVQTPQRVTPGKFELQLLRQKEAARNCKELEQVLLESAPHRDVGLRTPATTLRLAKALHATGTIQVGTTVFGLSQIVALLEQIEQDSDSARKKLTEQKARISKNQEAVQSELNAFSSSSKFGIVLWATEFSEFYWPYVLITYLGLKIARVDYLEKFQESRRD
jgi:hypothetical protein